MGLFIKLKRIEHGYKQGEFARKVGISRQYLSLLENGSAKNPSVEVMKKISLLLDTGIEELFFKDQKMHSKDNKN
jgi:putative transcriptional regulator